MNVPAGHRTHPLSSSPSYPELGARHWHPLTCTVPGGAVCAADGHGRANPLPSQ